MQNTFIGNKKAFSQSLKIKKQKDDNLGNVFYLRTIITEIQKKETLFQNISPEKLNHFINKNIDLFEDNESNKVIDINKDYLINLFTPENSNKKDFQLIHNEEFSLIKEKKKEKIIIKAKQISCMICFIILEEESKVEFCSGKCGHVFCYDCYINCLKKRKECPYCKKSVRLSSLRKLYFINPND